MRLHLNPAQFQALVGVIADAFDQNELDAMLRAELGKRLAYLVALPMQWQPLVVQLVDAAERHALTDRLVLGVAAWRPAEAGRDGSLRELMRLPGQAERLALSDDIAANAGTTDSAGALEALVRRAAVFTDVDEFLARLAALTPRLCRIEVNLPGESPRAVGTGFLVGDDRVLTNKHVLDALPEDAARVGCRFDHRTVAGSPEVRAGTLAAMKAGGWRLAARDYAKGDAREGGAVPVAPQYDYALLRLAEPVASFPRGQASAFGAGEPRGHVALGRPAPPAVGSELFVLQHPQGEPLKLAVGRVRAGGGALRLRHDAPTEPGSSGSPCFDARLDLVALHHAAEPTADGKRPRFNQAVPIGLIADDLHAQGQL